MPKTSIFQNPFNGLKPGSLIFFQAIVLAGLITAVYLPSMQGGFLWDDDRYLTQNPLLQNDSGLSRIWLTTEPKDYYPVLHTVFWVGTRLWGLEAMPYHLLNVVLHAFTAVLLWRALAAAGIKGAYFCSLLFALHPINVESVAWISQCKNTLSMFFFMLCVLCYLKHDLTHKQPWHYGSIAAFALSLLSKPIAIAWPVIILAHYGWKEGRIKKEAFVRFLPFAVIAAIISVITIYFQYAHSLGGEVEGHEAWSNSVGRALGAWLFYLVKIIIPLGYCTIYPEESILLLQPANIALIFLMALIAFVLLKYKPAFLRHAAFGLIFYTAMILPVLGFVKIGYFFYSPVADHWVYGAAPGILALISAAGFYVLSNKDNLITAAGLILAGLLIAFLGFQSYSQNQKYVSQKTLWQNTVEINPRAWIAQVQLGNVAFHQGDIEEAAKRYEQGLALKPDYWEAINGLGVASAMRGDFEKAIACFQKVLAFKPEHPSALRNLELAQKDLMRNQSEEKKDNPAK